MSIPPAWRLPEGVNPALWEYAHTPALATTEDAYFLDHPLLQTDLPAISHRFAEPGPLVDLGCGAGRAALHFARRGFPSVAVDLARPMLQEVARRARRERLAVGLVKANLCRLGCFPEGTFAYALTLFSTLGMIRGPTARRQALRETARILQPGGRLALHAHNFWLNLQNPQGIAWLLAQTPKTLLGRPDAGDRRMTYRGIPNLEVHLYRWSELKAELRQAGLRIEEVLPLHAVTAQPIPIPWLAHPLRAGGWLLFARRPPY